MNSPRCLPAFQNVAFYSVLIFMLKVGAFASAVKAEEGVDTSSPQKFTADLKEYQPRMKVFQGPNGRYVVFRNFFSDGWGTPTPKYTKRLLDDFFTGDGNSFYQLAGRLYGGKDDYEMNFIDPRFPKKGDAKLLFKFGVMKLICGDKSVTFSEQGSEEAQKIVSKATFNPLPVDARTTQYVFKLKDSGAYIYVDASKFNFTYESFKMYRGQPGEMKEVKISSVNRLRDGGTTFIKTADGGALFSPTDLGDGYDGRKNPAWTIGKKTVALEKIEPEKFDIQSLGIKGVSGGQPKLRTPCDQFFPAEEAGQAAPAGADKKTDPRAAVVN